MGDGRYDDYHQMQPSLMEGDIPSTWRKRERRGCDSNNFGKLDDGINIWEISHFRLTKRNYCFDDDDGGEEEDISAVEG